MCGADLPDILRVTGALWIRVPRGVANWRGEACLARVERTSAEGCKVRRGRSEVK